MSLKGPTLLKFLSVSLLSRGLQFKCCESIKTLTEKFTQPVFQKLCLQMSRQALKWSDQNSEQVLQEWIE